MNADIRKLVEAIKKDIGPAMDLTDLFCHRGITTAAKCGRCAREMRIRQLIDKLEEAA